MVMQTKECSDHNGNMGKLLVVSASSELAEYFMGEVCGPFLDEDNAVKLGGLRTEVFTLVGAPEEHADWDQRIAGASALMLLVEHVDALSIKELKVIYDSFPMGKSAPPIAFFIVRHPDKHEFKVSCLKCGQKIMLRDEFVGRSCLCPGCRKSLLIMSQKMALRQQLGLSIDAQVEQVDASSHELTKGALEHLTERATPVPPITPMNVDDVLANSTMRISLSDLK